MEDFVEDVEYTLNPDNPEDRRKYWRNRPLAMQRANDALQHWQDSVYFVTVELKLGKGFVAVLHAHHHIAEAWEQGYEVSTEWRPETTPAAPYWTICDRIIDITDLWREIADPENIRGAECLAYLDRDERVVTDEYHCDRWQTCFRLRGVRVSDDNGTKYCPRSWAEGFFGGAGVWAIEEMEMEAAT